MPGINDGICKIEECSKRAHSRGMCSTHYRQRYTRNQRQVCNFPDCRNTLAERQGRRAVNAKYRRLCRAHEHLHLIEHRNPELSYEVEQFNRQRLVNGITTNPEKFGTCWVFQGAAVSKSGYPTMRTHLSAESQWLAHRVAWGLLMGGHKQRQQLDHLCGCAVGPGCISPAHLEPVSTPENNRRKYARRQVRQGLQSHKVKACGRTFNREAIENPKVQAFALEYGLPLPVIG